MILVYGMSTLWEDIDCCAKKYRRYLAIYLITVLLSSYSIIMDCEINSPGHGKNVVDVINSMENFI